MTEKFRVKLKKLHDATGLSRYAVAKKLGISPATVSRYVDEPYMDIDYLMPQVIHLIEFYGADWHDPEVLELIEDNDGESAPNIKTPAFVPA